MILRDSIIEIFKKNIGKKFIALEVAQLLHRKGSQVANVRRYLSKLSSEGVLQKKVFIDYAVPNVYWMEGNEK